MGTGTTYPSTSTIYMPTTTTGITVLTSETTHDCNDTKESTIMPETTTMKEITTTEATTTSVETTTHDCDHGVESTVDITTETTSLLSTIMTSLSSLIPITNSHSGTGANCHLTQTAIQTMVTNMSMKNASAFEVVEQMDKEW